MMRIPGAIASFLITIAGPAGAETLDRAFSAQDTMSICIAVAHQPETAIRVLEANDWAVVPEEEEKTYLDQLAVAHLATSEVWATQLGGKEEGADFWQGKWPKVQKYIGRSLAHESAKLLKETETGALLLTVTGGTDLSTFFSCLLAVPSPALTGSSYFPKLRAPTAPALSLTKIDMFGSDSARSGLSVTSASLDPKGISTALGISTDIGAAFYSQVSHPVWALEP